MRILVIAMLTIVASCASGPPTTQQLASMSDAELCETVKAYPTRMEVMNFMVGRGLKCHPAQVSCKAAGYKPNSQEYCNCINTMVGQIYQDQADVAARKRAALQYYMWATQPGTAANPAVVDVR